VKQLTSTPTQNLWGGRDEGERLCNRLVILMLVAELEEGIWHHQSVLVYPSAIKMGKDI